MDKDFVLKILKNNSTPISDASVLVSSYCEEMGKPKEYIPKFINIIVNTGIIQAAVASALDYYKKKYNITELKDNQRKTILYY